MQRGELSNAIVPRWLFTLDAMTDGQPLPTKRLWRSWEDIAREAPVPRKVLGAIWAFYQRTTITCAVVVFGMPDAFCDALLERFDRQGIHPIRFVEPYASREALSHELAFRPDVQTVVDLPEYAWQWGGRGMSIAEVTRVG